MLQTGEVIPNHYPTEYVSATTYTISGHLGVYISTATAPATWTLPELPNLLDGTELLIFNQGTHDLTIQAPQSIGDETEIVITPSSSSRLLTTAAKWLPSSSSSPPDPPATNNIAVLVDSSITAPSIASLHRTGLYSRPKSGWEWAFASGSSPSSDISTHMTIITTTDQYNGCIVLTGTFTGTIAFGSTVLTSVSPRDMFATCLRPDPIDPTLPPSFLWTRQFSIDCGTELIPKIAWFETKQTIYIAGYYKGDEVDFGDTYIAPNATYNSGFVVELQTDGTTTFLYTAVGDNTVEITDMYIADNFDVKSLYVCMNSKSQYTDLLPTGILVQGDPPGTDRIIVACIDQRVNVNAWGWSTCSTGSGTINAISITEYSYKIYVTGEFSGTVAFGAESITSPPEEPSLYIASVDNGSSIWSPLIVQVNSTGTVLHPCYIIAFNSRIYITGFFNGTVTFGDNILTSSTDLEVFVADTYSNVATIGSKWFWAAQGGNLVADSCLHLKALSNSLYLAGTLGGSSTFGSFTYSQVGNTPQLFIASISYGGDWLWLTTTKSSDGDRRNYCLAKNGDDVLICCTNTGTVLFDGTEIVSTAHNIVIAKIGISNVFPVMVIESGIIGETVPYEFISKQYTLSTLNGNALIPYQAYYYHPEVGTVNITRVVVGDNTPSIPIGFSVSGALLFRPQ
jgi:hypothetical protein